MGKLKSGEVRDFQIWTIPTGLPEILPRAYGQRGAAPAGLGAVYCGRRARSEGPAGGVGWVCPIAPKGAPRAAVGKRTRRSCSPWAGSDNFTGSGEGLGGLMEARCPEPRRPRRVTAAATVHSRPRVSSRRAPASLGRAGWISGVRQYEGWWWWVEVGDGGKTSCGASCAGFERSETRTSFHCNFRARWFPTCRDHHKSWWGPTR